MGTLFQDVRYALRQLRQAPGFACTAPLILALGIGGTSALFRALDTITFVGVILLLPVVSVTACEVARVADRIDPIVALRCE